MRHLFAVIWKEFIQFGRNRIILRRMLTTQVLNFVMIAWLDVTVRNMPLVVVDQDRTTESREVIERVMATRAFEHKYSTTSVDQAREHIRAGRAKAALVVPPGFGRDFTSDQPRSSAHVLTLVDGSETMSSSQAILAVQGVMTRMNLESGEELVDAPTVTPHSVLLFNPQGQTSMFMLPALFAFTLALGYSMHAIRGLMTEREAGHLERLLMTPISYLGLLVGKMMPWFLLAIANGALFLVVMHFGFAVPVRGSLLLLFFALACYAATCLSIGMWIGAGAKSSVEAHATWVMLNVPGIMLSGYIFPLTSLPSWLRPVSYVLPQTHFIEAMRGICLRGAGASELVPELFYLFSMPILISVLAARRFGKTVLQ